MCTYCYPLYFSAESIIEIVSYIILLIDIAISLTLPQLFSTVKGLCYIHNRLLCGLYLSLSLISKDSLFIKNLFTGPQTALDNLIILMKYGVVALKHYPFEFSDFPF